MLQSRRITCCWILGYLLNSFSVSATSTWTEWFNTDNPYDGIEEETINRIKEGEKNLCDGGAVKDAECRIARTTLTFKDSKIFANNVFKIPCNVSGLLCRDRDQPGDIFCSDYEIRYLCKDDNTVTVYDGGFIAMAAGLSVIVPLLCVLIVQLKRAKTERRRQQQQAGQSTSNGAPDLRYNDPPPTYEELFGENAALERYGSTEGLIQNSQPSAHGRTSVSSIESQSDLSVSTISGDVVEDQPIISGIDNRGMDNVNVENEVQSRPRRHLGMHISIHDLYNYGEPMVTTPPPSYNEALEILKMLPSSSQKMSSVHT